MADGTSAAILDRESRPTTAGLDVQAPPPGESQQTQLLVGGMTCASCSARVEKKLGKLSGVTAAVNYATGKAFVVHPAGLALTDLVAAVESAGYSAAPAPVTVPGSAAQTTADGEPDADEEHTAYVRRRLLVALGLSVPAVALSMVPAWQFRGWAWVVLALTVHVVVWLSLIHI